MDGNKNGYGSDGNINLWHTDVKYINISLIWLNKQKSTKSITTFGAKDCALQEGIYGGTSSSHEPSSPEMLHHLKVVSFSVSHVSQ